MSINDNRKARKSPLYSMWHFSPWPSISGEEGSSELPQDLLPKPGREVSPVSIRCSQTTQLEGEAKSPCERQAGSRAPTARQREGRGQSHRSAEGHALGPTGAQRPWVPVHGQARWRQPSEAIMRMAAVSSMDPVPACAFSLRVEQSWVKGQMEGLGCSWASSQVHSRGDTTTCGPHGAEGQSQVLPILSGAPPGQQDPGISISCLSREWSSVWLLMLEALFRNPNYPEAQMEHTYSGVALEEVVIPPQADVRLQEAQRSHPGLESQPCSLGAEPVTEQFRVCPLSCKSQTTGPWQCCSLYLSGTVHFLVLWLTVHSSIPLCIYWVTHSLLLRQIWDLGSFAAMLALGHLSFSNKIQRNYMGLKITMCTVRENSRQKIQREQKTQMPFLRSLE